MGVLELYWRQHVGAQQQLPALPDPQPTQKNQNRDSGPVRKLSQKPPEPSLQPRGRENRQNRFLAAIWGQNSPRMLSESVRLRSPSTPEIDLVKICAIKITISSKKPPTPGWLGVPKMYLTRKFLLGKAFYTAAVRAAGGGWIWAFVFKKICVDKKMS